MNIKDLMAKLDIIAEAPADPSRAQYDKFKADDAKAAAVEQVKKWMTTPLNDIGRLGDAIDPKTGIIYYGDAGGRGGEGGEAKPYPYDWLSNPNSTSTQSVAMYKVLGPAGLKVIPVEKKGLFGSYQVAGISPDALANIDKLVTVPDSGQGGKPSPCSEKIAKLNMLLKKLEAAKKGDSGQGGKPADTGDVMQRLQQVGVPVKENTILGIEQKLLLEFGYQELDEYNMQQFGQDASDAGRGAFNGVTLGTGDNMIAGAKSLIKGTKYKDELGKELAATKDAETRSPYLYGGANLAGSVFAPIPGGALGNLAVKGAKAAGVTSKLGLGAANLGTQAAANLGATYVAGKAVDAHNASVLGPAGQGGKTQGDPKVHALQQKLIAAGAKIKADGIMGQQTKAAMQQFPTVKESVAESLGGLRDRLAMLEQEQSLDEANPLPFLAKLFGKGGDDAAAAATKAVDKVAPTVAKTAATSAANTLPSTVRLSGETWTKTGNNYLSNTGKSMPVDTMALKLGKTDAKLSPGGTKVQGQGTRAANAGNRTQNAMTNMVRGSADDAAKATGNAADDIAKVAASKATGNAADDIAKVAAAGEAKAASKAGKLTQWAKANPGKAALIGLAGIGTGAYVANRVLGGDDTDTDRRPTTPIPTPGPAPTLSTTVDTTAIENEIGQLMSDLAQEPECQKDLAAARQELARITGNKNIGSLDAIKEDELDQLRKLLK